MKDDIRSTLVRGHFYSTRCSTHPIYGVQAAIENPADHAVHAVPPQPTPDYPGEAGIVWLEDPATLRYVRSTVRPCPFRSRKPGHRWYTGRLIGYATLAASVRSKTGMFPRRMFTVAPHDPYEGKGAPSEAVDPLTVTPGFKGQMTERAWGGSMIVGEEQ